MHLNLTKYCDKFTGYGGGYNDRGVVEYKEHRDSDDEYDEFGRRKRKIDERPTHREDSSSSSRNESSRNESSRRFVKTIIPHTNMLWSNLHLDNNHFDMHVQCTLCATSDLSS